MLQKHPFFITVYEIFRIGALIMLIILLQKKRISLMIFTSLIYSILVSPTDEKSIGLKYI